VPGAPSTSRWRAGLGLAVALFGLNLALSFHNLWPTLWVTTRHELSVEVAGLVVLLALAGELGRWPSRGVLRWLAVLVLLFTIARYMEVTAPALYGRRINLYWDAQHLPHVLAMLIEVMPAWQVWLITAGFVASLAGLYLAARWLLGLLVSGLADTRLRRFSLVLSGSLLIAYMAALLHPQINTLRWFSLPVSSTYAQQAGFVYRAVAGDVTLDTESSPLPTSNLAGLGGADVLVLFFESYGATTLDLEDYARALADARQTLNEAIVQNGYRVVSARVRSPTFGGGSWLAHSSFLSGIEITDNQHYELLLTRQRHTLVQRFANEGYRTVGLMPGLKSAWPEGTFYGYDKIYDAETLDYSGPAFGWWRIPDQFALARFDALEVRAPQRAPLMTVMTTISSHAPFRPMPPYISDWQALLGAQPYPALAAAEGPHGGGGGTMAMDYIAAVDYVLTYVAGYLKHRGGGDLVLIVIGDHQPPARVSGPDASWDVPVHVVTGKSDLVEVLKAEGFSEGLEPPTPALGPMHQLAPQLLRAFDGSQGTTGLADAPGTESAPLSAARQQSRVDVAGAVIRR
jgi:hypothetical protein